MTNKLTIILDERAKITGGHLAITSGESVKLALDPGSSLDAKLAAIAQFLPNHVERYQAPWN